MICEREQNKSLKITRKQILTVVEIMVDGEEAHAHVLRRAAHVHAFLPVHQEGRGPPLEWGGRRGGVVEGPVALVHYKLRPLPEPGGVRRCLGARRKEAGGGGGVCVCLYLFVESWRAAVCNCICVLVFGLVCVCVVFVYIGVHVCLCICVLWVEMFVFFFWCMCFCVYVWLYVCLYMCLCARNFTKLLLILIELHLQNY